MEKEKSSSKISSVIPYSMVEILDGDSKLFNLDKGAIGNKLLSYYAEKDIEKLDFKSNKSKKFQFNLTKLNFEMFDVRMKENKYEKESDYLRDILFTYINNPRYARERILYSENFEMIEKAIKDNKKISFIYMKKAPVRTVNPYFMKIAEDEQRTYLFCYCEKNNDYRAYRISEITNINFSKNEIEIKDKKYINEIEENFDPFISYGKNVKVKFTEQGEALFERLFE